MTSEHVTSQQRDLSNVTLSPTRSLQDRHLKLLVVATSSVSYHILIYGIICVKNLLRVFLFRKKKKKIYLKTFNKIYFSE